MENIEFKKENDSQLVIKERYYTIKYPIQYYIEIKGQMITSMDKDTIKKVLLWLNKNNYTNYYDMPSSAKMKLIKANLI